MIPKHDRGSVVQAKQQGAGMRRALNKTGCDSGAKLLAASIVLVGLGVARADTVDARCDIYPKGDDHASAVLPCTFSQRQGYVGIDRADGVRHELEPKGRPGTYVDDNGKPAHRIRGLGSRGQIYRLANETIYVYWNTAGLPSLPKAPASTTTPATTSPNLTPLPRSGPPSVPFDKTLTLQGVTFRVQSANRGSVNRVEIKPAGLSIDNSPVVREIDGTVSGVGAADLNVDGSPEIYVFVTSAGSGSYGSLVAFSANRRKSLSEISLPAITDHATAAKGYQGHDEFAVVENTLVRRFPLYREGDINAAPTGGIRQLQYKLERSEATWVLRVDRVVDY